MQKKFAIHYYFFINVFKKWFIVSPEEWQNMTYGDMDLLARFYI